MGDHHLKIIPKIMVDDHISVPGDTRNLTAEVKVDGVPKAGFVVKFSIDGYKAVGNATTGANGKASLSFTVPDTFTAKVWTVRAHTDATGNYVATEATGKLTVIKGPTAVVLSDLHLITSPQEPDDTGPPGNPFPAFSVDVVQNYGAHKPITFYMAHTSFHVTIIVKVNGVLAVKDDDASGGGVGISLFGKPPPWKVEAEFPGNESYTGSEATRTYTYPP